MACDKEKIVMAFYNEASVEEKDEIFAHIKKCDECLNFYNSLSFLYKNIQYSGSIKKVAENKIMLYSRNNLKSFKNYFSKIFYSFSLSFAAVALFIIPQKNIDNANEFENKIYSIESAVAEISYDIKFVESDLNSF